MADKSKVIFGNEMPKRTAASTRQRMQRSGDMILIRHMTL